MRLMLKAAAIAALLLAVALPASASHARRGPTSHLFVKKRQKHARQAEGMDPSRATEIQAALIKAGYMTGEPTGTWDSTSEQAMQKMQADNGWQTKITPDSRALIKLGLGPNSTTSETATSESTAQAALTAAN